MPDNHFTHLRAEPVPSKFASISHYMFALMLRNIATSQWVFSKKLGGQRILSKPGCIIASPSVPADIETNQDYVHFWVRDGALTINECAYRDLPTNEMLNDYVYFSRIVQKEAEKIGKPAHACFRIDGSLRPWGQQGDGPGLRILSILEIWDRLSDAAKLVARDVLADDRKYIREQRDEKTHNAWEEVVGHSFFTRAAQRHATEQLRRSAIKVGLPADPEAESICADLSKRLEEHWDGSKEHYLSILDGETNGSPLRGHELNADLIFAATYAGVPCLNERMLKTVFRIHAVFEGLYGINAADAAMEFGPLIGRYPGDYYDGTPNEGVDGGHPWPLCTANLARFYYQCIVEFASQQNIVLTESMWPFFNQIGFDHVGEIQKSSLAYKELIGSLLTAGDRLMRAIVYHSDHLELSEQNDRDSGFSLSVRSLTWSYSSFLAASRTREKAQASF